MAMSEDTPWWYSAAEEDPRGASGSDSGTSTGGSGSDGRSVDLWALLGSLQRLATWAQQMTADQVLAPHADHTHPAAHPTCVVCRTMTMLADVRGFASTGSGAGASADTGGMWGAPAAPSGSADASFEAITWLTVHRGPCKR